MQGFMNKLLRPLLPIVLVLLGVIVAPASANAQTPFFSSTSVWNTPLATNAPLAGNSGSLVSSLRGAVTKYGSWINTDSYSTPIYTLPSGAATARVTVTTYPTWDLTKTLQTAFNQVPVPANVRAAAGTDASLVIYQPSTDTMWEFWQFRSTATGFTAAWGGKMTNVSQNAGIFPNPYGATSTSLPLTGGLMTISELQAGHIDHALAFAMPHPAAGTFVYPAQRTDGDGPATSVPEGTRFRLPANLNIDALYLPPAAAMMAKAVQRYGMILDNKGGNVAFYGEDPTQQTVASGVNPYWSLFSYLYPNYVLGRFPWDKLQVVKP
jgi:hypothetical protein